MASIGVILYLLTLFFDYNMELELKKLGFSDNQATVYLALLALEQTSVGPIVTKTGLHRQIVYNTLASLEDKGLVQESVRNNRKQYQAMSPKHIIENIKKQELYAEEIMPTLMAQTKKEPLKEYIFSYTGHAAVKQVYYDIIETDLKPGEEYYVLGADFAAKNMSPQIAAMLVVYHQARKKRGVKVKLLFKATARDVIDPYKSNFEPGAIRFLPDIIDNPMQIITYKDKTILFLFEKEPITMVIKNQKVADSYKQYFDAFWNRAKPLEVK